MSDKIRARKHAYGLSRGATSRPNREFVDFDYVDSLPPEEREWLANFSAEYYQTTFDKETDLHNTPELRKQCYARNNASVRDLWNQRYRIPTHFGDGDAYEPESAPVRRV